jgi:hypothetical protein
MVKWKIRFTLSLTTHTQYLYSVRFSQGGKTIFAETERDFEAYSASTAKQLVTYSDCDFSGWEFAGG